MGDEARLLEDPDFRNLLKRRSRWRWGLSGFLILAYFVYAIAGIYFAEAYSQPFLGTSIPFGMAIGNVLIILSIALSIAYVRIVNRLEDAEAREKKAQE
ncbi:MAG: DUF485 domain-containing protein [Gammaproteobacteria bacterium]|nr:DUF485 domain-containing protein [Gammaproteobacteria bacterium]